MYLVKLNKSFGLGLQPLWFVFVIKMKREFINGTNPNALTFSVSQWTLSRCVHKWYQSKHAKIFGFTVNFVDCVYFREILTVVNFSRWQGFNYVFVTPNAVSYQILRNSSELFLCLCYFAFSFVSEKMVQNTFSRLLNFKLGSVYQKRTMLLITNNGTI